MLHWISKYSKNYENVTVTDVTSRYSGLSLIGPASTNLLQSLTQTPLDVDDFPVNTIQVDFALKLNYKCFYTGYYYMANWLISGLEKVILPAKESHLHACSCRHCTNTILKQIKTYAV